MEEDDKFTFTLFFTAVVFQWDFSDGIPFWIIVFAGVEETDFPDSACPSFKLLLIPFLSSFSRSYLSSVV